MQECSVGDAALTISVMNLVAVFAVLQINVDQVCSIWPTRLPSMYVIIFCLGTPFSS